MKTGTVPTGHMYRQASSLIPSCWSISPDGFTARNAYGIWSKPLHLISASVFLPTVRALEDKNHALSQDEKICWPLLSRTATPEKRVISCHGLQRCPEEQGPVVVQDSR